MKIPFRRISQTPQAFEVESDAMTLKGVLSLIHRDMVLLDGELIGKLSVPCDVCAEQFDIIMHDKVQLLLCDGVYTGSEESIDVIEMNETIDLDELLHSEIELIRSDYHTCSRCEHNDDNVELI
jgi:uncharacterized metal-binding protein YceD (DUF177 family)